MAAETGRLVFGSLYILLSASAFPVYCLIITVFLRVRSFRKHSCYWIMSALGAFNCLALVGLTGLGLRVVVASPFPALLEKFLFAIHRFGLTGCAQLTCLLAFNRFCVLTDWIVVPSSFYIGAIVFIVVYVFSFIAAFLTDYAAVVFNADLATNYYNEDLPYTAILDNFDCTTGLVIMTSALVMYIVITVFLIAKRFSLGSGAHRVPIERREVMILIQGLVDFCFEFTLLLNATTFVKFIPRYYYLTGSYVIFVIVGTGWMSPMMYLFMNKSLRKEASNILSSLRKVKLTPSNMIFSSSRFTPSYVAHLR